MWTTRLWRRECSAKTHLVHPISARVHHNHHSIYLFCRVSTCVLVCLLVLVLVLVLVCVCVCVCECSCPYHINAMLSLSLSLSLLICSLSYRLSIFNNRTAMVTYSAPPDETHTAVSLFGVGGAVTGTIETWELEAANNFGPQP